MKIIIITVMTGVITLSGSGQTTERVNCDTRLAEAQRVCGSLGISSFSCREPNWPGRSADDGGYEFECKSLPEITLVVDGEPYRLVITDRAGRVLAHLAWSINFQGTRIGIELRKGGK